MRILEIFDQSLSACAVPSPSPTPMATIAGPIYEYQVVDDGPTATPSPTPSPSPTPYITLTPDDMTYEED